MTRDFMNPINIKKVNKKKLNYIPGRGGVDSSRFSSIFFFSVTCDTDLISISWHILHSKIISIRKNNGYFFIIINFKNIFSTEPTVYQY